MTEENKNIKILIVEDEAILAQDISYRLQAMNYEILGIAATAKKTIELIKENPHIDLLLLDIIIKGEKDGIELARIINDEYQLPFIFLTSHSDLHLVERAKSVKSHGYILKPFNSRQVNIAIELALANFSKDDTCNKIPSATINNKLKPNVSDSLFLKKDSHFEKVQIKNILFLKADSNYTTLYTERKKYIYATVLKKIETLLPSQYFFRVHRSYVVNINRVDGFEGNQLFIEQHKIPISKKYRSTVQVIFQKI